MSLHALLDSSSSRYIAIMTMSYMTCVTNESITQIFRHMQRTHDGWTTGGKTDGRQTMDKMSSILN